MRLEQLVPLNSASEQRFQTLGRGQFRPKCTEEKTLGSRHEVKLSFCRYEAKGTSITVRVAGCNCVGQNCVAIVWRESAVCNQRNTASIFLQQMHNFVQLAARAHSYISELITGLVNLTNGECAGLIQQQMTIADTVTNGCSGTDHTGRRTRPVVTLSRLRFCQHFQITVCCTLSRFWCYSRHSHQDIRGPRWGLRVLWMDKRHSCWLFQESSNWWLLTELASLRVQKLIKIKSSWEKEYGHNIIVVQQRTRSIRRNWIDTEGEEFLQKETLEMTEPSHQDSNNFSNSGVYSSPVLSSTAPCGDGMDSPLRSWTRESVPSTCTTRGQRPWRKGTQCRFHPCCRRTQAKDAPWVLPWLSGVRSHFRQSHTHMQDTPIVVLNLRTKRCVLFMGGLMLCTPARLQKT